MRAPRITLPVEFVATRRVAPRNENNFNCVVCFYYIPVTVYRYCYSYLINLSLFNYLLRIIITKFNSFIILLLLFRLSSSFSCLV